jgi:hypothetical protein
VERIEPLKCCIRNALSAFSPKMLNWFVCNALPLMGVEGQPNESAPVAEGLKDRPAPVIPSAAMVNRFSHGS